MFYYYVHGISILSEIQFPEFTITKKLNVDVLIRYGDVDLPSEIDFRECNISNLTKVKFKSNIIHLLWNDIKIFTIYGNKEIIINPETGLDENFLKLFILGYAIAMLLHKRGRLILHANAVNMYGGAVLFIGDRGRGKSTISLALNEKGHNLLSDDVLSIQMSLSEFPKVIPGFPGMKLWPESIVNINENPEVMPKLHFNTDKRYYSVKNNFSHVLMPIKIIYLIEKSNGINIENMKPQEAVMELIKSSYCFKLFDNNELSENLKKCTKIVNSVPVKRLKIKHSFENLPNLVKIIEDDVLDKS